MRYETSLLTQLLYQTKNTIVNVLVKASSPVVTLFSMKKNTKKTMNNFMSPLSNKIKITASVVVIVLSLALIFLITLTKEPPSAVILVPEGYKTSWEPFIGEAAVSLKLKKVLIHTWSSQEELENLLSQAKKLNIIFAEVPIDFHLKQLEKKGLIAKIAPSLINQKSYTLSFIKAIQDLSGTEQLLAIPFSFDPWITLTYNTKTTKKAFEAVITIPAKSIEGSVAVYGLGNGLSGEAPNKMEILSILSSLQKKQVFQQNAFTYNGGDALAFFQDNRAIYTFIAMSNFRNIPTEDKFEMQIVPLPVLDNKSMAQIIATGTVIVFPYPLPKKTDKLHRMLTLISDPEILIGITKKRNTIPATTDAKIRDFQEDTVRTMVRNAPSFIFSETLFESSENRLAIIEELKQVLVTR